MDMGAFIYLFLLIGAAALAVAAVANLIAGMIGIWSRGRSWRTRGHIFWNASFTGFAVVFVALLYGALHLEQDWIRVNLGLLALLACASGCVVSFWVARLMSR